MITILTVSATALAFQAAPTPARRSSPNPQPLTPNTYFSLRTPHSPALSPDGRRVAYVVSTPDLESGDTHDEVWVAEIGGASPPRQITRTRSGASDPAWSPDGRALAYRSEDPAPDDDDDDAASQVWLLHLDGGSPERLTDSPTGVERFSWLADGRGVVYMQEEERPAPVRAHRENRANRRYDARVVGEPRPRHELWFIDGEGGDARRITRGTAGLSDFRPSPNGRWIAYVSNPTGDDDDDRLNDLWFVDIAGDQEPVRLTSRPGSESNPSWSWDGTRLAFTAWQDSTIEFSNDALFVMDVRECLAGGHTNGPAGQLAGCPYANVSERLDRDVEDYRWTESGELLATFDIGTNAHLFRVDPSARTFWPLVSGALVVDQFDVTRDGRRVTATIEGPASWPDVWTLDIAPVKPTGRDLRTRQRAAEVANAQLASVTPRRLTRLNPELDSVTLAPQEVVRWAGARGDTVEGILVHPVTTSPQSPPSPLLVVIHGGPHSVAENTLRTYYTMQLFAARGYAVLSPNFRGSSGYGNRWATLNRGDLGGDDFRDIMAGVDAMIARGVADSTRLAIKGLSYGGYMTNWAVTQTNRFKAAISESGIASFVTDYSNSYIPSWEHDYLLAYHWENPRLYAERSPLSYVARIHTPMLIVHGDEDSNTAPANSIELWRALKQLGRTVEFVRYPREEHGLDEPNHRLDKFRREAAWLDRWVLGSRGWGVGDEVPSADSAWTMTVTDVDDDPRYAGEPDSARYVEVTVMLRRTEGGMGGLQINWTEDGKLDGAAPVGVPLEALGTTTLVRGPALTTNLGSETEAIGLRLVFPALTGGERRLEVRGFPGVRLR